MALMSLVGSVGLAAVGIGWHAKRSHWEPWARSGIQARRSIARRGGMGIFYFGSLLGVGVLTEMTTPLVVAGFLMAGVSTLPHALAYGRMLGVADSTASLATLGVALTAGLSTL